MIPKMENKNAPARWFCCFY